MDNPRKYFLTLLIDIVHAKLLCTCTVKLDGNHGIFFSIYILCLNINLWSVECSFPICFCILDAILIHNITQILLGAVPICFVAQIFFFVVWIPFGQTVSNISIDTKCSHYIMAKFRTSGKFFFRLFRAKNNMCLCNSKLSDTGKSMHLSGVLIPEQCRSL